MIVRGGVHPGVDSDNEQDKGNDDVVERRYSGKLHSDFTATSPCCEACRRSNSRSAVTVTAKSLRCSGSTIDRERIYTCSDMPMRHMNL